MQPRADILGRATDLDLGSGGLRWFFALPQADFFDQRGNEIALSDERTFAEIAESLQRQIPAHYRPAFIGTGHRAEAGTLGLIEKVRVLTQAEAKSHGIDLRAPAAIMLGASLNAAGRAMDEAEELEYCSVGLRLGWTDETGERWPAFLREFTATAVPWLKYHNIPARELRGLALMDQDYAAAVTAAIDSRVTDEMPRDAIVAKLAEMCACDPEMIAAVEAGDTSNPKMLSALGEALGIDADEHTEEADEEAAPEAAPAEPNEAPAPDADVEDVPEEAAPPADDNTDEDEEDLEMSDTTKALAAELEAANIARAAAEQRAAALEQRVQALEMADRQRKAEEAVAAVEAEFALSDESRRFAVELALSDETGDRFDAFVGTLRDARKPVKAARRAGVHTPGRPVALSLSDSSPESRAALAARAREVAAERGVSFSEAVRLVDSGVA